MSNAEIKPKFLVYCLQSKEKYLKEKDLDGEKEVEN